MFNRSEIFKAAHAEARYFRRMFMAPGSETYAQTFSRFLKEAWYRAQLAAPAVEVETIEAKPEPSPELAALEFEHMRRDRSDRRYFGSKAYNSAQSKIQQLKQAA